MEDSLLLTLLNKTGKARFVDWLEYCTEDLSIKETILKIKSYNEYGYTPKSYETRVHNIRTIIKAGRVEDALITILEAGKLPGNTKDKALRILEKICSQQATQLPSILDLNDELETDRLSQVKVRLGQNRFRKGLLEKWGGCSITQYKNCVLLIASHIKPWKVSSPLERVDPENGLLLLPHLDKLFDRGFISFNEDGYILISKKLNQPEVFNLSDSMRINLSPACRAYMDFHVKNVFLE